jgi:hypothetical protein
MKPRSQGGPGPLEVVKPWGRKVVVLGTTWLKELRTVNSRKLLLNSRVLSEAEVGEKDMHTGSRWRSIV